MKKLLLACLGVAVLISGCPGSGPLPGAPTNTSVTGSPNPSTVGQVVKLDAMVTSSLSGTPTGTVTFAEGATVLGTAMLDSSGHATFSTSSLTAGTHSITATYGGDSKFASSVSAAVTQTVNKLSSTTTITSSGNTTVFGQAVTFTGMVTSSSGTPTGMVTFLDGTTTLGTGTLASGQATFMTSALTVGMHSITAMYSGDATFASSTSSALAQTVNKASTTTAVTPSANPLVFGQPVTFTMTASPVAPGAGTPTGTVNLFDGATQIGSRTLSGGTASFMTSSLSVGAHSITAIYVGDNNFSTSTSAAVSEAVNKASTTTAVTSSVNPSALGQTVTFTATVSAVAPGAGTPTGTVTFMDGATLLGTGTLSSGQATFTTSSLSLGTHPITATYSGDTNFNTSTSSTLTQTVNAKTGTATAIASSANPSTFGAAVTFTATVTPASGTAVPTGTVTFLDGATTLGTGTLNASGVATFSTSSLAVGSHTITAQYGGDATFNGSTSAPLPQVVNPAKTNTTTSLASSQNPSTVGQSVTFTATVTPASGSAVPTGTVTFLDGSTTLGTGTLGPTGTATFSTGALTAGTHMITASYGGDANFNSSTSAALTQTVNAAAACPLPSLGNESVLTAGAAPYTARATGWSDTKNGMFQFAASFLPGANGTIVGGRADINGVGQTPAVNQSFTGCYNLGAVAGTSPTVFRGMMIWNFSSAVYDGRNTVTFAMAVRNDGKKGTFIEFDDASPNPPTAGKSRLSAEFRLQDTTQFTASFLNAPFGFLAGGSDKGGNRSGVLSAFTGPTSCNGTLMGSGALDFSQSGTSLSNFPFTLTCTAPDATYGRGTVTLTIPNIPMVGTLIQNFGYFVEKVGQAFVQSTDALTGTSQQLLLNGVVIEQTVPSGGFTLANSFNAAAVVAATGFDESHNGTNTFLAIINSPGDGTFTGTLDQNADAMLLLNQATNGTLSIGSNGLGVVTITNPPGSFPISFVAIAPNTALLLEGTQTNPGHDVLIGLLQPQKTTTTSGSYIFASDQAATISVSVESGVVTFSSPNITGTSDQSSLSGVSTGAISGTFTLNSSIGRGVITPTGGGSQLVFATIKVGEAAVMSTAQQGTPPTTQMVTIYFAHQ